jgi:outer membrane protein
MKTKIIYLTLIIASVALSIFNYLQINHSRIACVDTEKVFKSFKGVEEMSKRYEERNKHIKQQLDTLLSEFQTRLAEFEKKRVNLSKAEIEMEERELRKKQDEYVQYQTATKEGLKKEEQKVIEKAAAHVSNRIKAFAKRNGYSAIIGATPTSGVLYMGEYVDVTEDIIAIVND